MRKMMTKEVTFTSVKVAQVVVVDGKPDIEELGVETFMGNKTDKQLEKEITAMYGIGITLYDKEITTKVYEMEVEKFIEYATVRDEKAGETE